MANKRKVKELVEVIEQYLSEGGQVEELREVVAEFDGLLEQEEKENTAVITTAFEMDETQKKDTEQVVRTLFDRDLEFEYRVDPSILGGMKIKLYDQVVDMSFDTTLTNLSQKLKQ